MPPPVQNFLTVLQRSALVLFSALILNLHPDGLLFAAAGLSLDPSDDLAASAVISQAAEQPQLPINVGHAGAWYNTETPGQGLMIDIEPTGQSIFLAWFTYTDSQLDTPNQQHWYTGQGEYSGDIAYLGLYETLGGEFDGLKEPVTKSVGRLALSFSDCNQAFFAFEIDANGREGEMLLQRAIPDSGAVCEQKRAGVSGTQAVNINAGMDGAWISENTPGQGFLIDAQPDPEGGNFIFVAWFTYGNDTASGQRWLTAQGSFAGSSAAIDVYETTGGSLDDSQSVNTEKVGTMTLDFQDCNNALLSYLLTDESLSNSVAIHRAIPGAQALCEELAGAD
jgi:hypothetical protein